MSEAASIRRAGTPLLYLGVGKVRAPSGERLALGTTAAAIAMLPLLVPAGPGNVAPVDALLVLSVAACLLWAATSGHRWRFPYVVPMGMILVGGALGGLAGSMPGSGIVALIQDVVLLAWCWAVVSIASSAGRLKVILATWAYSSIAWAVVLFVGLLTGSSVLTGHVANQGSRNLLTLADPNYAANYFFISIMIVWATARPRRRGLRLAAYALLLAALASTGSNSGIVALIVGIVVANLVVVHRRHGAVPAITALAFIVLGGYLMAANFSLKGVQEKAHDSKVAFVRDGIGRSETSVSQRDMLLTESIGLYEKGSPLGEGPASTKSRLHSEMAPFEKEAHDDYLAGLIERGAVGFLGVLLLVSGLGLRALSVVRKPLADALASVVARPNALLGAVAGTMVSGTVYELLHVRHVWALFALVAGLYVYATEWTRSEGS
jgi:hypothetical protein